MSLRIAFIDTPAGVVPQTDVAKFYESILANKRISVIEDRLYKRFGIKAGGRRTYTHGLLLLASLAKRMKHNVKYHVLDEPYFEDYLEICDRDILCLSCKTTVVKQCLEIALRAKFLNSNVIVIFGGVHSTFMPDEILDSGNVDIVCFGESEETFRELIDAIDKKKPLHKVKGIKTKDIDTGLRDLVDDINTLGFVDYSILPGNVKDYYIYSETRRGCPFKCAYCANPSLWNGRLRTLSAEVAYSRLDYIAGLVSKNSMVHISNPSFGFSHEDLELCQMLIDCPLSIFFSCDLCASFVDKNSIDKMYRAGFRMFSIGMESVSSEVLSTSNRPGFDVVRRALVDIKDSCDAFVKGYWLVGLPGETEESARKSRDEIIGLLREGLLDMGCEHIFVPYPGSDVYANPDKYDYLIYSKDWEYYDSRSFPLPGEGKNFSMNKAYLAYLDLVIAQCEFYGIDSKEYYDGALKDLSVVSFIKHKKCLV